MNFSFCIVASRITRSPLLYPGAVFTALIFGFPIQRRNSDLFLLSSFGCYSRYHSVGPLFPRVNKQLSGARNKQRLVDTLPHNSSQGSECTNCVRSDIDMDRLDSSRFQDIIMVF
ncbi:hypothetical protein EJ02DRAFT_189769 [Clathrospora elynae]|uniref:Uncharacterized protein n=1 Tax=Clathrospora elynae TaxID=706981 RepID=A0A6A5SNS7_9PLEO|nr:hypothetical protein EJ02DRAFT_189769 [Clathrospora elynae]